MTQANDAFWPNPGVEGMRNRQILWLVYAPLLTFDDFAANAYFTP
jgi:hypothetical protein